MTNTQFAPVVLTVYNRPEHTKKTLSALAKNYSSKQTDLFIFSDGAKDTDISKKGVEATRDVLNSFPGKNCFKSFNVVLSSSNNGLGKTIIESVSSIIAQYQKVIVLEDDLVTSDDFLDYMNEALNFYQHSPNVWSISGYTFNMERLSTYEHDVYSTTRGCSWGWGTWQDRWESIDWNIKDYTKFRFNPFARHRFSYSGNDMPSMLDAQMCGEIDSWAIRWCYNQFKKGAYTIYPKLSRVENIGVDGSGTHSNITSSFDSDISIQHEKCRFEIISPDKQIMKEFRSKFHRSFKARLKQYIKHLFYVVFNSRRIK